MRNRWDETLKKRKTGKCNDRGAVEAFPRKRTSRAAGCLAGYQIIAEQSIERVQECDRGGAVRLIAGEDGSDKLFGLGSRTEERNHHELGIERADAFNTDETKSERATCHLLDRPEAGINGGPELDRLAPLAFCLAAVDLVVPLEKDADANPPIGAFDDLDTVEANSLTTGRIGADHDLDPGRTSVTDLRSDGVTQCVDGYARPGDHAQAVLSLVEKDGIDTRDRLEPV
jgi:hypothetical protein